MHKPRARKTSNNYEKKYLLLKKRVFVLTSSCRPEVEASAIEGTVMRGELLRWGENEGRAPLVRETTKDSAVARGEGKGTPPPRGVSAAMTRRLRCEGERRRH